MSVCNLQERINALNWYHRIDLGNGIVTPSPNNTGRHLPRYRLPDDFSGNAVLDIGAYNGFFTFETIRRNATRTLALDRWTGPDCSPLPNFELARDALGMRAPTCDMSVYDMSPEKIGRFDISLFLGVLYHLRHPQLALDKVAEVTSRIMIIETYIDALDLDKPAGVYYPDRELNNDPTNFWGFNPLALEAMMFDAGFAKLEPVSLYFAPNSGPGEWLFIEPGETMTGTAHRVAHENGGINHARAVYHAYK